MLDESVLNKIHFEKLFKRFYGKLIFFANKYVNDMEIAEEQVSLVFAKLWEKRESYCFDKLPTSFLYTMVKNNCISYIRHKKVENEYFNYLQKNNLLTETPAFEENSLILKEFKEHIEKAIENLPPRCKEVFKLSRYESKMNREIAENLNISVKTVERQMSIALERLRFNLQHLLNIFILYFFL